MQKHKQKYLLPILGVFILVLASKFYDKHYFLVNQQHEAPTHEIQASDPHMNKIPEDIESGEIEEPKDQQSPVAIDTSDTTKVVDLNLRDIVFHYTSKRFEVKQGEHAIETFPQSIKEETCVDYIILDEMGYRLVKFHIHMPGEHTINGERYPLEIHFVHTREKLDDKGNILRDENNKELFDYAVIGVFVKEGKAHPEFEKIIARMPHEKAKNYKDNSANIIEQDIDLMKIIPSDHRVLRYYGSLTTKPFTTGVKWQLIKQPIEFSKDQLDRIAKAMNHRKNARKEQRLRVPVVNDIAFDKEGICY